MNKLFTHFKNIFSIKELKERVLFTLAMLVIYRFGSYILLPGVDPDIIEQSQSAGAEGLLGMIDMFTGGAFAKASILGLGIMPYISASIVVQLLGFAVPYFQRLQNEGESGYKKITQITRWLTVIICLVQGSAYITYISAEQGGLGAVSEGINLKLFAITGLVILTAGTIFSMWLGERITEKGIGNGVSLLITVGIIARLPVVFYQELTDSLATNPLKIVLELVALFLITLVTVAIVQAVRKIPLQFAGRTATSSRVAQAGARDYLPVKLNSSGVMPIIFAQAIMFIPSVLQNYFKDSALLGSFSDIKSFPYNALTFFLIVIFTYVYTALMVNPHKQADHLKQRNAFIPGVKPGANTAEYIDNVVTKITLPGSIMLGLIAIIPAIVMQFGVGTQFALFFGGTTLLIMVAVVIDTLAYINGYLLMNRFDGILTDGISGRKENTIGADF